MKQFIVADDQIDREQQRMKIRRSLEKREVSFAGFLLERSPYQDLDTVGCSASLRGRVFASTLFVQYVYLWC